jgi:IS30 family transposase
MLQLGLTDIEEIEKLASQGYSSTEIALVLDVKPTLFSVLCKDEDTVEGKAYLRGVLVIERKKRKTLLKKIKKSETAIQIHDKHAKDQTFKDIKNDVFSDFNFIDDGF